MKRVRSQYVIKKGKYYGKKNHTRLRSQLQSYDTIKNKSNKSIKKQKILNKER